MSLSHDLTTFPKHLEMRWASPENPTGEKGGACRNDDGRKRRPCVPLPAGQSLTLAEVSGTAGMVRRIWITIYDRSPKMLRGLRLDMYWDGAQTAAVSAPLGDFFCQAMGRMCAFENELFSSPEGRSFNCCMPMPFRTGMKIIVRNETDADQPMFFYDVNYTLGDAPGPYVLYAHCHWRRENPTTLRRDYELLPQIRGRGRFLGASIGVKADTATWFDSWWGEGEVKMYLDGDNDHATLCGTGTEDYIGTGWGQKASAQRFQGSPLADRENLRYGFYRLHIPDPVYFRRDIRITIQQMGWASTQVLKQMLEAGRKVERGDKPVDVAAAIRAKGSEIFERQDDWSSCAYFYLDRPENGLPALVDVGQRTADLD